MKKKALALVLSIAMLVTICVPGTWASEETTTPETIAATVPETTEAAVPETTASTEETTEPNDDTTNPTGETTDPTGEATDPTGEPTDPTEGTTVPTEDATEPTEETTASTEPEKECTCGTETGEHAEGCPLYEEPETTEPTSALTEEQKALYDAILACKTLEELEELMQKTDMALYGAMYAALSEEERATLDIHVNDLYGAVSLEMARSVTIDDTIMENGSFTARPVGGDFADKDYEYQWYVSDSQNGTYAEIVTNSTVTGNAQTMYVARDGARKWYKVKITYDGETKESAPRQVEYYDALQNGSFETPKNNTNQACFQKSEDEMFPWKTTGKGTGDKRGKDIEIVSAGKDDSADHFRLTESNNPNDLNRLVALDGGYTGVVDGTQCAELNCEAWGALYQDVLTEPGSTLYWSYWHRGRFGTSNRDQHMDEMQLIIRNAADIPENWNPAGDNNTGDIVKDTSSANSRQWVYNSGDYEVPDGQYVTRFYFVSTAAFDNGGQIQGPASSVGNLLDQVHFDTSLPPLVPSYGSITVKKEINEDLEPHIPLEAFTFTITNGSTTHTISLPFTSYEGTVPETKWERTVVNLEPGPWTVTEVNFNVPGLEWESTLVDGKESTTKSTAVTLTKGRNVEVEFTNTYKEPEITINYIPVPPAGGTVSLASSTFKLLSEKPATSTASANPGYTFKGWYDDPTGEHEHFLSTSATWRPDPELDGSYLENYYAVFEEQKATINYVAKVFDGNNNPVTGETGCTVSLANEKVDMVTGTPRGSIASAGDAYQFVGWYSNEDCTREPIGTQVGFTPTKKADEMWADGTTYYAKFIPNLTSMTISKSGTAYDSSDSFIFDILDKDSNKVATITLKIGESKVIDGLTVRDSYTIVEHAHGRYNNGQESTQTVTVEAGGKTTVSFTNNKTNDKWLTSSMTKSNKFVYTPKPEVND